MTKRKSKATPKATTAAELMAELNADPRFVARERKEAVELKREEAEDRKEEAPLIRALRKVGVQVDSVWDLVNTAEPYPEAVPVLLEHLHRPYSKGTREGIARALAVPGAIVGWDVLVKAFEEERDPTTHGVKWALGCALAGAATNDVLGDVARLLKERKHGANRFALLSALLHRRSARAKELLAELNSIPEIAKELKKRRKANR